MFDPVLYITHLSVSPVCLSGDGGVDAEDPADFQPDRQTAEHQETPAGTEPQHWVNICLSTCLSGGFTSGQGAGVS